MHVKMLIFATDTLMYIQEKLNIGILTENRVEKIIQIQLRYEIKLFSHNNWLLKQFKVFSFIVEFE